MTIQEKQVALKFQGEDLRLRALKSWLKMIFMWATAITSPSLYGHHNNKHPAQMRRVKTRKRSNPQEAMFTAEPGGASIAFWSRRCTLASLLQRLNHSYPVSNCICHQRPGRSGSLAQEGDQTRRSKQYPLQAAGGGRGFWGAAGRGGDLYICYTLICLWTNKNRANYSTIVEERLIWLLWCAYTSGEHLRWSMAFTLAVT